MAVRFLQEEQLDGLQLRYEMKAVDAETPNTRAGTAIQ
jgi:hypothetical protein